MIFRIRLHHADNAKRRIELYHRQLTRGCGSDDCTNDCCASSPLFIYRDLDSNAAAATALQLLMKRAPLCVSGLVKSSSLKNVDKNKTVTSLPQQTMEIGHHDTVTASSCKLTLSASTGLDCCSGAEKSESCGNVPLVIFCFCIVCFFFCCV